MNKKYTEKQSCVKKCKNSLVKITGLFLSVGILLILISCGKPGLLYDRSVLLSESVENNIPEELEELEIQDENKNDIVKEKLDEKLITVHICGAVNSPGVYKLKSTDRVIDAVVKAGGFSEEASEDALNLASKLSDGCKIYFPTKEEMLLGEGPNLDEGFITASNEVTNENASDTTVNINTASKEKLMTLKGVGESRAQAIIDYREQNGAFNSIEEIMNISGIKAGSFEKIKDNITVN